MHFLLMLLLLSLLFSLFYSVRLADLDEFEKMKGY